MVILHFEISVYPHPFFFFFFFLSLNGACVGWYLAASRMKSSFLGSKKIDQNPASTFMDGYVLLNGCLPIFLDPR